jgi:hypothetical protein
MRTLALGGWACALALTVGCGGSFVATGDNDGSTPGSDAGSDGGGSPDTGSNDTGSPDSGPTFCPAKPPTKGGKCSPDGIECEYGSNPNADCNELFDCTGSGWTNATPKLACAPQSDCPASYASITGHKTCPASELDLTCAYPLGTCICSDGELPVSGGPFWNCVPATATCPSPRPKLGSACTEDGTTCDYGACEGGTAIECKAGYWQMAEFGCPA